MKKLRKPGGISGGTVMESTERQKHNPKTKEKGGGGGGEYYENQKNGQERLGKKRTKGEGMSNKAEKRRPSGKKKEQNGGKKIEVGNKGRPGPEGTLRGRFMG